MPKRPARHSPRRAIKTKATATDDQDRGSAAARGYGRQWQALRKMHLAANPLCVFCATHGRVVAGSVVDHIRPHKGNRALLFDPANLQTLCKPCHDSTKQRMERGTIRRVGADGMPIEQGEGGAKL